MSRVRESGTRLVEVEIEKVIIARLQPTRLSLVGGVATAGSRKYGKL